MHTKQQQQKLFIFTVAFYTFCFTHFRIPWHLHWLCVFWVSALIVLLSSLVQRTHTHSLLHYICSRSHALSACHLVRSVAGPGTRPCPSNTPSHTHKHARIHVNKRLSVSLRFEKSNSDLFCQAHRTPNPYRTQLTAYGTVVKNNKKIKCSAAASLQLVPYFWHSRLLKMELLFVVYRRIVAITWLGTICLHVECFYVWSTRFYRYVTSTSYHLPTCPCLLQLILTLNSDSTLSHMLQLRTPSSIGIL